MTYIICVVVALLCLVTLTTTASAECAWVLWLSETQWSQLDNQAPQGTVVWKPDEGFLNLAACNSALSGKLRLWKERMETSRRYVVNLDADGRRAHTEKKDTEVLTATRHNVSSGVIAEVTCLPDTVDPRGPRGTTR